MDERMAGLEGRMQTPQDHSTCRMGSICLSVYLSRSPMAWLLLVRAALTAWKGSPFLLLVPGNINPSLTLLLLCISLLIVLVPIAESDIPSCRFSDKSSGILSSFFHCLSLLSSQCHLSPLLFSFSLPVLHPSCLSTIGLPRQPSCQTRTIKRKDYGTHLEALTLKHPLFNPSLYLGLASGCLVPLPRLQIHMPCV